MCVQKDAKTRESLITETLNIWIVPLDPCCLHRVVVVGSGHGAEVTTRVLLDADALNPETICSALKPFSIPKAPNNPKPKTLMKKLMLKLNAEAHASSKLELKRAKFSLSHWSSEAKPR